MEEKECRHWVISGVVQGVGFRAFVKIVAGKIGVEGVVRNLLDGRVEVLGYASSEKLDEFFAILKKGPKYSQVEKVEENKVELEKELKGFRIVP